MSTGTMRPTADVAFRRCERAAEKLLFAHVRPREGALDTTFDLVILRQVPMAIDLGTRLMEPAPELSGWLPPTTSAATVLSAWGGGHARSKPDRPAA
jgi:hypothetical protein